MSDAGFWTHVRSQRGSKETTATKTLVNDAREASVRMDDEELAKHLSVAEMVGCATKSVAEVRTEVGNVWKLNTKSTHRRLRIRLRC